MSSASGSWERGSASEEHEGDDGAGSQDDEQAAEEEGAAASGQSAEQAPAEAGAEAEVEAEADWVDAEDDDFDADALEEEWVQEADALEEYLMGLQGDDDEEDLDSEGEDGWGEDDEEELNDWADWMEAEADALSQSSQEPEMEQTAAADLAAATAERYIEPGSVAYRIPTAHYHFQSADALALAPDYAAADGSMLLAAFDRHGVAAWLVPGAGDVWGLRTGAPQGAVRLGGFQHPSDIFTMTCSRDGRYIVTGGESGILAIYTVDPAAPPRPTPAGPPAALSGVTYFYTPIIAPTALPAEASPPAPHNLQLFGAGGGGLGGPAGQGPPGQAPHAQEVQQAQQQGGQPPSPPPLQEGAVGAGLSGAGGSSSGGSGEAQQAQQAEQEEQQRQHHAFFHALMSQGVPNLAAQHVEGEGPDGGQEQVQPPQPPLEEVEQQELLRQVLRSAARSLDLMHEAERNTRRQQREEGASGSGDAVAGPNGGGAAGRSRPAAGRKPGPEQGPAGGSGGGSGAGPASASQLAAGGGGGGGGGLRGRQRAAQQPGQPAAVMMACMVGLGLPEDAGPNQAPFHDEAMTNGVRFGLVGGKHRLVAAEQSGYAYVFEVPPSSCPRAKVVQQILCSGLGEPSPHWRMLPVSMFRGIEVPAGVEVRREARVRRTAAIGPFPAPVNLAIPSPDGRWLAVAGDAQAVWLVDQAAGFSWESIEFDIQGSKAFIQPDISIGAQYCAWHPDSSLLAISSDGLHATFIFKAATRQLVYRVEGHTRPCLGLMFAPWDPSLLVYNEETKHVFLRRYAESQRIDHSAAEDLAAPPASGLQLLRVPLVQPDQGPGGLLPFSSRRRRITGMAAGPGGDLFVATKQGAVLRYFGALGWAPERHSLWPPAFRAAARELLLCAHRRPAGEGHAPLRTGLWALPVPVVLHIVEALAGQRTDWMD